MSQIHELQPVLTDGVALPDAKGVMIAIHGRGTSAQSILELAQALERPNGWAYLAPQARGASWYPYSFLMPLEQNEPFLSSALNTLDALVLKVLEQGIPAEKLILLGFSQGACLALEYAARNPRRYGGVVALSGGLIGAEGTPRDYHGSFEQAPVFMGCSDVDFHIPVGRVHESAEVLLRMGAQVDKRIYPNMGHTVNQDELEAVRGIMDGIAP